MPNTAVVAVVIGCLFAIWWCLVFAAEVKSFGIVDNKRDQDLFRSVCLVFAGSWFVFGGAIITFHAIILR